MGRSSVNKRLWELRINAVVAYDKWMTEKAIKSTKDKINVFSNNDVMMNPRAMQEMIHVLEQAKKTSSDIIDYGRSVPVVKKEEKDELIMNGALGSFGRSVCTSNKEEEPDTAVERINRSVKRKEKKVSNSTKGFYIEQITTLEEFMVNNNIQASFKCKSKKVTKKQIEEMKADALEIELDDEYDRKKILSQIKKIGDNKLFDYCDKKPYQCLVCPYYYKSFKEFYVMKTMREEKRNEEE